MQWLCPKPSSQQTDPCAAGQEMSNICPDRARPDRVHASYFLHVTPHERRKRELEAMRGLVVDLDHFVNTTTVGTVRASEVADAFERHTAGLPPESKLLAQYQDLAVRLRGGPTRTRVEGIRQIARKIRLRADDFAHDIEARDARLRGKG